MSKELKHRINAGRVAVKNQVDFFHAQLGQVQSEWKPDDTRVTFADFAISEKIFAELRRAFPKDHFCSEESNPQDEVMELEGRYTWLLDPIDGTDNFALGVAVCGISLALLVEGVPAYGFFYDANRRRLVHGGPGHGLWDGSQKAEVKPGPLDATTLIGVHFPVAEDVMERHRDLIINQRLRCTGSCAINIAHTAIGLLDGSLDYRVKVWDLAAGAALVEGGGGEFHAISKPIFPLKRFHVDSPRTPFYSGSSAFCRYIETQLPDDLRVRG